MSYAPIEHHTSSNPELPPATPNSSFTKSLNRQKKSLLKEQKDSTQRHSVIATKTARLSFTRFKSLLIKYISCCSTGEKVLKYSKQNVSCITPDFPYIYACTVKVLSLPQHSHRKIKKKKFDSYKARKYAGILSCQFSC